MKSKRTDGRGHWPRGKPRSALTELEATLVRSVLAGMVERASRRAVARLVGVSESGLRKILAGGCRPSVTTRDLVLRLESVTHRT